MTELFKQFDAYSLKARVFPALIAGFPVLALLFVLVPWDHLGVSHAIATAMGLVLLFAFSDLARSRGRKVQKKLGSGETLNLWYRENKEISEISKSRFRVYIAGKINQPIPTEEDESFRPEYANDFYRSAGDYIRDRTRDASKFSILLGENITYGFRRNLLGLKPVSLLMNFIVLAICIAMIYWRPVSAIPIVHVDVKMYTVVVAAVLHSLYMLFAVNKGSVYEASKAYGRQLILSCDTVMMSSEDKG